MSATPFDGSAVAVAWEVPEDPGEDPGEDMETTSRNKDRRRLARPGQDLDDPLAPQMALDLGLADAPSTLPLHLLVEDREVVEALVALRAGAERDRFALTALRLGVLALQQARGEVDVVKLRREGDRLVSSMQQAVDHQVKLLQQELTSALREYLDPESGKFHDRVSRLVAHDGEIARVLQSHVGSEDSEIAKTLTRHLGETSPLFRLLDPEEADGMLGQVRQQVEALLGEQRQAMMQQFSLDDDDSALSRLVRQLTDNNGKLKEDLAGDFGRISAEFSLDNDDSALSRMVRKVDQAHDGLVGQFSLDDERSALSRLKRELGESIEHMARRQRDFHDQVATTLAELAGKREAEARGTAHGLEFEAAVGALVETEVRRAGDLFSAVGNSTGLIRNCKKGDHLVELGPDSPCPGGRVVIEAKEDRSYDDRKARDELETARKNRDAEVGVFVFSAKTAGDREPFRRVGHDLFVVWDADDPASDVYLKAAVTVARALVLRGRRKPERTDVDLEAIDRAILAIGKEAERLDRITKSSQTIRNSADTVLDQVRIMRANLEQRGAELTEHMHSVKAALVEG